MGRLEGAGGQVSVPPPGWGQDSASPAGLNQSPVAPLPARAFRPADAAVRWRISAAVIDNFIVYGAYLLLCVILHWRLATPGHLLVFLLAGFAYHFALEARDGQTIGKRQYGISVTAVDGSPATIKAVAIRSALRLIDQLPVLYVSGLISMVRTGPARRQRIGDVVAGTTVVAIEGRSAAKGTPRWLLPTATVFAFAISVISVYGIVEADKQPLTGAQAAGFVSGCQRSTAGQLVDCGCLLSQLEASGHDSLSSLRSLESQAQEERFIGQSGPASRTITTAFLDCRR